VGFLQVPVGKSSKTKKGSRLQPPDNPRLRAKLAILAGRVCRQATQGRSLARLAGYWRPNWIYRSRTSGFDDRRRQCPMPLLVKSATLGNPPIEVMAQPRQVYPYSARRLIIGLARTARMAGDSAAARAIKSNPTAAAK